MSHEFDRLTRRAALSRGFGGVAGLAFVCSFNHDQLKNAVKKTTAAYTRSAANMPFEPFTHDLPIWTPLRPKTKSKDLETYDLTVEPGKAEILDGFETPILGYGGVYPGPLIHATRGRATQVTFTNQAQRDLVTHLHGGVTPHSSDGYPSEIFVAGEAKTYTYPNVQRAATLWYHDHSHGETARTLYAGLAGMYILGDKDEDALELPQGEFDVPLMIQDRSFNADGSLRYQLDLDLGFRGDTILVNGAVAPRMTVKRRLYRFRVLNASNSRPYTLQLGDNRPMTLIGTDGGLLPRPVTVSSIAIEPAMRRDFIVDFRKFGVGSKVVLRNTVGEASTTAVMRFDVVRGGVEDAQIPAELADEQELPPVNAERTWALTFQGLGLSQWQISGQGFDYSRIDCYPRQGSSELWTFHNYSDRTHPMHTHLAHFKVVSVNGAAPDEVLARGMHDTVRVGPQQEVVIRPWFDYYSGLYVFHCHASEHGDMSMMGQMQVTA